MKKTNKKGFTLIELLAVIVILGVLMLTAIPAVTRSITKSRRNTYWQNAKQYIQAAQAPFLSGEYVDTTAAKNVCGTPAVGSGYYIFLDDLELEGGSTAKSSFGALYSTSDSCKPRVIVTNEGKNVTVGGETQSVDKIVWYFVGTDQSKNGIDTPIKEGNLGISKVKVANANTTCTTTVTATVNGASATITPARCTRQ